jgi:hypothetical protein
VRQKRIDETRQTLAELRANSAPADEVLSGDLLETWPELTTMEKRELMHGLLERIELQSLGARTDRVPIEQRTRIFLRGGQPLD